MVNRSTSVGIWVVTFFAVCEVVSLYFKVRRVVVVSLYFKVKVLGAIPQWRSDDISASALHCTAQHCSTLLCFILLFCTVCAAVFCRVLRLLLSSAALRVIGVIHTQVARITFIPVSSSPNPQLHSPSPSPSLCLSSASQVPLQSTLAFGGVGGLALGLSARDIAANFLGGMLLLFNEPFTPGDMVKVVVVPWYCIGVVLVFLFYL